MIPGDNVGTLLIFVSETKIVFVKKGNILKKESPFWDVRWLRGGACLVVADCHFRDRDRLSSGKSENPNRDDRSILFGRTYPSVRSRLGRMDFGKNRSIVSASFRSCHSFGETFF